MGLNANNIPAAAGEIARNYLYMFYLETYPSAYKGDSVFQTNIDYYNTKAMFPERKTANITLKWSGQSINFTGVDESPKTGSWEFLDDESGKVFSIFSAMQELSGSEAAHSANITAGQNFNVGIAQVSVTKKKITKYRRFKNVKVLGVKLSDISKDGSDLSKVTISVCWDSSETDTGKIGTALEI